MPEAASDKKIESPQDMLAYVVDVYGIDKALPEERQHIIAFAKAYERSDKGPGEKYRMKIAGRDYEEFKQSQILPGYVRAAHRELKLEITKGTLDPQRTHTSGIGVTE